MKLLVILFLIKLYARKNIFNIKDMQSSQASLCLYELQNTIYSYAILFDDKFRRVISPGIVDP